MVMSGHLDVQAVDPGVPASFSTKVLIDLLRGELGFTGVVITDALNMEPAEQWPPGEAAVRAMLAGNDLLLMPPDLAQAHDRACSTRSAPGGCPGQRLVEAVTRILTLQVPPRRRRPARTCPSWTHRRTGRRPPPWPRPRSRCCAAPAPARWSPARSGSPAPAAATSRAQWLAEALAPPGVTVVPSGGTEVHLVGYGDGTADLARGAAVTVAMDTPVPAARARLAGPGRHVLVHAGVDGGAGRRARRQAAHRPPVARPVTGGTACPPRLRRLIPVPCCARTGPSRSARVGSARAWARSVGAGRWPLAVLVAAFLLLRAGTSPLDLLRYAAYAGLAGGAARHAGLPDCARRSRTPWSRTSPWGPRSGWCSSSAGWALFSWLDLRPCVWLWPLLVVLPFAARAAGCAGTGG